LEKKPLYIETFIHCDLGKIWEYTQEPSLHQQWDLRFSEITYLPKSSPEEKQCFLYSRRIGLGISVNGIGESIATKSKTNGESTSVLKFSSESNISLIRQGSGYWKYIPEAKGIRFLTGYDYTTRWGLFGRLTDRFVFRPLMIWATAWSFECLKNWIEKNVHPQQAINAQFTIWLSSIALGMVWFYQGLVPKLLFPDTGEAVLLQQSGIFHGYEDLSLKVIGIFEILFGLLLLFWNKKALHLANLFILILLLISAAYIDIRIFSFPFNPFSLNISMMALSIIAIINFKNLPKAFNCITTPKK
jgi:hypothetical protein